MIKTMIESRVTDPPLQLHISEKAFHPNPVTVRFARSVQIEPGDVVFDIGTGIGPLAIKAAMDGAAEVVAVDPVAMHCELARKNVESYGLQDRVQVYHGSLFEPFERKPELRGRKADVIIGDVSGIADAASHALGWYSDEVPTGGEDGTNVLIDMISRAGRYLKPDGWLYFPIALDLSDGDKLMQCAHQHFATVENALSKPFVQFPLSEEEVRAIDIAYPGTKPPFINIQGGKRPCWRGVIIKVSGPISAG